MLKSQTLLLALLTAMLCGLPAAALDPNQTLQQFDHTSWTIQAGAPSGINALAQTTDGYLWLGTTAGLYRFDGVSFELYQPPRGQSLPHASIQSLYAAREGGLWIGYTLGETTFLENGNIHNYFYKTDKPPRGTVISFLQDQDGSIWAAAASGLGHFSGGKWQRIEADMHFDSKEASYLLQDREGTLWVTTTNNVYFLAKGAKEFVKTGFKTLEFAHCVQTPDGTVWIEDPLGVVPLTRQMPKTVSAGRRLLTAKNADGLMVDRDGTLWEFPDLGGVLRISFPATVAGQPPQARAASLQHFTHLNGLTSDQMAAYLEDHEGNIWIATTRGLDRFRMTVFTPAPIPESLQSLALATEPNGGILIGSDAKSPARLDGQGFRPVASAKVNRVTSLYAAPDGKIWIGGNGTLGYLHGNDYFNLRVPPDPDKRVGPTETQAMTTGPDGDLWISIGGRAIARVHNGDWQPDSAPWPQTGNAATLVTDHGGLIWAGYRKNLVSVHDGNEVHLYGATQGLNVGDVTAMQESASRMWVGGEHGLNIFENGRFIEMIFAGRPTIEGITGIVFANDGSLWLNALKGIFRISKEEVAAFLADPHHAVNFDPFNYLDGIPGDGGILYPLPTAIKGTDGRLWFSTTGGLVYTDPAHIYRNAIVPSVTIRGVRADGLSIEADAAVQLAKGTKSLEIDYTAPSLSIPERVRFKYKLEGFDKDWQEAGTRRQAFYTSLPPGRYSFHVIACNNDGVWNTAGVTLPIDLPAAFLQSWYFKLLCVTVAAVLVWCVYLLRINQAEGRIRTRLYERLAERERIARDLHDTFFQGIQGLLLRFDLGMKRLAKGDPVRALFEDALTQSDQVMRQGRELVLDLRTRSSEAGDLAHDLEAAATEFAKQYPAQFTLVVTGKERALNSLIAEELYKLGSEALFNSFRHASATSIESEIIFGAHELGLNVRDDGTGVSQDILQHGGVDKHYGLPGMKERAEQIGARFSIFSRAGAGTEIEVRVPSRVAYRSARRSVNGFLTKLMKHTDTKS
jgi:signal transduction histidine kinase/ligand-binding sensor domain-containing protein